MKQKQQEPAIMEDFTSERLEKPSISSSASFPEDSELDNEIEYLSSDESYSEYVESERMSIHSISSHSQHEILDWSTCHRSFFADSPYFNTFVDKEMQSLQVATETLTDISNKFKGLAKAGLLYARATRRLSTACQLQLPTNDNTKNNEQERKRIQRKRDSLGPEVLTTLERLGNMMEQIAIAQEEFHQAMAKDPLLHHLRHASSKEAKEFIKLRDEIKYRSGTSEKMFSEYLHGKEVQAGNFDSLSSRALVNDAVDVPTTWKREDNNNSSVASSSQSAYSMSGFWNRGTDQSVSESGSTSGGSGGGGGGGFWNRSIDQGLGAFGGLGSGDDEDSSTEFSAGETMRRALSIDLEFLTPLRRRDSENLSWPIKKEAISLARRKQSIQNIRVEQTLAELKRFQFFKNLVHASYQRKFDLSQSASKFIHIIQNNADKCSNIVQQQHTGFQQEGEVCEEKFIQYQTNDQPIWNERESTIMKKIKTMEKAAKDAESEVKKVARMNPNRIDLTTLNLEQAEETSRIWDLPAELAACTHLLRETPPGVQVEGWLNRYEEKKSILSNYSGWKRRWFILKTGTIHCLYSGGGGNDNHSNNMDAVSESSKHDQTAGPSPVDSIYKVKVCDVVLCTVREVPDKPSEPRFRFELIVSNQKPVILQASGPKELQRWVDGIRSGVEQQLVKGDPHSSELNQNIGKNKRSSEVKMAMTRGLSIFNMNGVEGVNGPAGAGGRNGFLEALLEEDDSDDSSTTSFGSNGDEKKHKKRLTKRIMRDNPSCADCGKASPEWVSLNLGVLVCLECSGVHRSLGVHVSQVRSLTLDSLSDIEASVVMALGNERVNKIYERRIPSSKKDSKPNYASKRKAREEWIQSKYVRGEFMGLARLKDKKSARERIVKVSRLLYKATKKSDVLDVAQFLAHGGDANWINKARGDKTALMVCVENIRRFQNNTNNNNDDDANNNNNNHNEKENNTILGTSEKDNSARTVTTEKDNSTRTVSTESTTNDPDKNKNNDEKIQAAFICAKLLVQNGAKTDILDDELRKRLELD